MFEHKTNSRTLFFHTGVHKTGSTALQVYLSENRGKMRHYGVSYAFPDGADELSGNGQYLYEELYIRNTSDERLDEILNSYFLENMIAVCSSEDFTRLGKAEWNRIQSACLRINAEIKIIVFIRDVAAYYFSLHGQLIKGGEYHTSFSDFCKNNQYIPVLNSLRTLVNVFGKESIKIIHYDSSQSKMDTVFMEAIYLNPDDFDGTSLMRTINRSLTEYEKNILSRVNFLTGRQHSLQLSTYLMNRRPDLKAIKKIDEHLSEVLLNRHKDDISWVNHIFFDDNEVLRIDSSLPDQISSEDLSIDIQRAIDKDVTEWCFTQLQFIQSKSIEFVSDRLRNIDWNNADHAVIPADFDPVAYLMLNEDVLKAGSAPYKHFIDFGQYEVGRKWQWS